MLEPGTREVRSLRNRYGVIQKHDGLVSALAGIQRRANEGSTSLTLEGSKFTKLNK